jgi:hypothetical protein
MNTVRSLISGKSFLSTHCHHIYIWKEISRPGFLDVNRYSVVHSIESRRVFLHYVNISMCKSGGSVSCPGLYGGLYGQNLPHKFKKSYRDFRNRNFEKSHRTTGPRSDLPLYVKINVFNIRKLLGQPEKARGRFTEGSLGGCTRVVCRNTRRTRGAMRCYGTRSPMQDHTRIIEI